MKRYGQVIGLNAEHIGAYKKLHADVWPSVLAKISQCHIRNYVIYLKEPENLIFASFEYHGTDFESDMATMAADPETQKWWALCEPMQSPLKTRDAGAWWANMEEVFFHA
jgi:L-rhamnose mutarotase